MKSESQAADATCPNGDYYIEGVRTPSDTVSRSKGEELTNTHVTTLNVGHGSGATPQTP